MKGTGWFAEDDRTKIQDQSPAHQWLTVQLEKSHKAELCMINTMEVDSEHYRSKKSYKELIIGEVRLWRTGKMEFGKGWRSEICFVQLIVKIPLVWRGRFTLARSKLGRQEGAPWLKTHAGLSSLGLNSRSVTYSVCKLSRWPHLLSLNKASISVMIRIGLILQRHLRDYVSPFMQST